MIRTSNIYEDLREELVGEKLRLDECEYIFELLSEILVGEAGFARYSNRVYITLAINCLKKLRHLIAGVICTCRGFICENKINEGGNTGQDSSFLEIRKDVFLSNRKFLLFDKNAPRGSHCGGLEDVAFSNPPQAESFASETLSCGIGNCSKSGDAFFY